MLDDFHRVQESLLGLCDAEQDRRGSFQGDFARGNGPHLDVVGMLVHAGVRLDVARAETHAELIVVGDIDPGSQVRQPLDAQLHQVNAVNRITGERHQFEGEVMWVRGNAVGRRDVCLCKPDRQRVARE